MGFAEASGVWMEDVAFGMWFESLQMSCRIIDKTFTQNCGGENTITVVDGLVRRADPSSICKVPAWIERDTQAIDMLGSVVCGTTAEAANADGTSGSSNGAFGQQLRDIQNQSRYPAPRRALKAPPPQRGSYIGGVWRVQVPLFERLDAFYRAFNPEKLANVPQIAKHFDGKEDKLNEYLRQQYSGRDLDVTIPAAAAGAAAGQYPNAWAST
jgi:hypothetical protein